MSQRVLRISAVAWFLASSAATFTVPILSTPCLAQEQDSATAPATTSGEKSALTEIVVTARRRDESLQEVPIAISALSGDQIASAQMVRANDLQTMVPNLSITGAFNSSNPSIFIRGVGNSDYNDNAGATIGVYLDDVYLAAPAGKLVQMFDLDNVQVLRGPQGTLFGKNNPAGAILLSSKKPDGSFDGYFTTSAGNYSSANFEGAVSFPISDTLWGRVALQKESHAGFGQTDDASGNFVREIGATDDLAGRMLLRLKTGSLDAVLNVNFSRARDDRADDKAIGTNPDGSNDAGFIEPSLNPRINYADYPELESVDTRGVFLNVNYDLDWAKLTSETAYYYATRYVTLDVDKSPSNLLHITRNPTSNQWSQELRLASNGRHFLDWVTGLYLLKENLGVHNLFAFGGPVIPFYPQDYDSDTLTYAPFAEGILHLTDKLSLTGGVRYTYDQRKFDIVVGPGGNAIPFTRLERVSEEATWRGILDYKLSSNYMVYASVSRGFQGGGFNGGALAPNELGNGYGPEFLTAYEVGAKTSFFDGKLTVNAAGFYYDYRDPQVFTINAGQLDESSVGLVQTIVNAKGATVAGGELELNARVTPTFVLNGSVGLLHSAYHGLLLPGVDNTVVSGDGNRLVDAPDFDLIAGATKTFPTAVGDFALHADLSHQSRRYFDITQREAISGAPYTLVNGKFSYTNKAGNVDVSLWCKNLFNTTYVVFNADLSQTYGLVETFYNPPRMYGIEGSYRF